MIGKLTGVVDSVRADSAILDVGGVGYLVFCSARSLRQLPAPGERARLLIETHVREDYIHLYGFIDEAERSAFLLLTTVQGVGARLALSVLGVLEPPALHGAIAAADVAALIRADGVGRKLAQRIVNELAEKVGAFGKTGVSAAVAAAPEAADSALADAVSALVNLGYRRPEAATAAAKAQRLLGSGAGLEALIPAALRELGR